MKVAIEYKTFGDEVACVSRQDKTVDICNPHRVGILFGLTIAMMRLDIPQPEPEWFQEFYNGLNCALCDYLMPDPEEVSK